MVVPHTPQRALSPKVQWLFFCLVLVGNAFETSQPIAAQDAGNDSAPLASAEKPDPKSDDAQSDDLDNYIQSLIQQMGDDSFATRRRAQLELQRIGLPAFDALQEAFLDKDSEIATAAAYLVNSAVVSWAIDTDTMQVKQILKNYGRYDEVERRSRMDRIASLDPEIAIPVLCRLTRYETSTRLSKQAALLIFQAPRDRTDRINDVVALAVEDTIGSSTRPGSQWLHDYVSLIKQPKPDFSKWERRIAAEHQKLDSRSVETNRTIVQDLYRWLTLCELDGGLRQSAVELSIRGLDAVEPRWESIRDASHWALEHKLPEVVFELHQIHTELFEKNVELMYAFAESHLQIGEEAKAEEIAASAFEISSRRKTQNSGRFFTGQDENTDDILQKRRLYAWAEREMRFTLSLLKPTDRISLIKRYTLADMLHDGQQEREAADVWLPLINEMESDKRVAQEIDESLRGYFNTNASHAIAGQVFLYDGLARQEENDLAGARESLEKAIGFDSSNADVLIAMYRLDGDEAWKNRTLDLIRDAADYYRIEIAEAERQYAGLEKADSRAYQEQQLSQSHNQLAWLVSNTTGDYQEALRSSLRSIELRPDNAGLLDTLGRCYYSVGDLKSAIKYQSKAVALEPDSRAMKRQLQLFQDAQAKLDAKSS